jgi:succinate dehydrogenase / fumarate reductase cytochrome b subunit
MIALIFILWHVFHMNGLIHADWFKRTIADPVGLAQFSPYNAASSAARAMQQPIVTLAYVIGVLACVFHFANGLWTMGITWGIWVTPTAQRRASHVCLGFGAVIAIVGLSAIVGFWRVDPDQAYRREMEMYHQRVLDGSILENEHKLDRPGLQH